MRGEWYPMWMDVQGVENEGVDASCWKNKVGLPEDFKWIKEDSDSDDSGDDEEPQKDEG